MKACANGKEAMSIGDAVDYDPVGGNMLDEVRTRVFPACEKVIGKMKMPFALTMTTASVLGSRGGVGTGLGWEVRHWMELEIFLRALRKSKKHLTRLVWSSPAS